MTDTEWLVHFQLVECCVNCNYDNCHWVFCTLSFARGLSMKEILDTIYNHWCDH